MIDDETATDSPKEQEEQNDASRRPQRRSVVAIVLGCVLIGFCLFFVAAIFTMFCDPPNRMSACLFGGLPAVYIGWVAFRQYRALFSCEPWKQYTFSGCFLAFAVFMFLPVISIVATFGVGTLRELGVMIAIAGISTILGILSVKNNRKHGFSGDSDLPIFGKHPPFVERYARRDLVGLLVLGLVTAGFTAHGISTLPPEYAANVSYEEMYHRRLFPENGRDFCYLRGMRGTMICEFTIDEQGFREWIISDEKWEYCRPIEEKDWVVILPPSVYETGKHEWGENEQEPVISDGLCAGYGEGKGGRAVFDRATNRAYYWTYY